MMGKRIGIHGFAVGLILIAFNGLSFSWNSSESLPYKAYVGIKLWRSPDRGELVAFVHPELNRRCAKRVIGLAGDKILTQGSQISVAKWKFTLHPKIKPLESQLIPEGYAFVAGDSADSFDSRYDAFGLIPLSIMEEKLWGFGRYTS